MKIERLFAIVFLLMDQKNVNAKMLADRFEVSTRTIYRDIDTLSAAGIPIYADRGRNGGIFIMDHFVFNKTLLSKQEQEQILVSLQTLSSIEKEAKQTSDKLKTFFRNNEDSWIDVDYESWSNQKTKESPFAILKEAIQTNRHISFVYYSLAEEKTDRIVEPYQVVYKGQDWYLYGFCRKRNDFRYFKLSRMESLHLQDTQFIKRESHILEKKEYVTNQIKVTIKVDKHKAYRIMDEMKNYIVEETDKAYIVEMEIDEKWLYSYLLTYQDALEVMKPSNVRNEMKKIIKKLNNTYKI